MTASRDSTFEAAIACIDLDTGTISNDEYDILGEIAFALYDAVGFYKHRAEGEICDTYAYIDPEARPRVYQVVRDVLWDLDVAWASDRSHRQALNFVRYVGGPIHLMMDRYRFIQDGLKLGVQDTEWHVDRARRNVKLWYRIDTEKDLEGEEARFNSVLKDDNRLLFPGLAKMLIESDIDRCPDCAFRASYGAGTPGVFGGVKLCDQCRTDWAEYVMSIPQRALLEVPGLMPKQG